MDKYEKIGYTLLILFAFIYIAALITAMFAGFIPAMMCFILFTALGVLLLKVIKERRNNKEDDYYSKGVDK